MRGIDWKPAGIRRVAAHDVLPASLAPEPPRTAKCWSMAGMIWAEEITSPPCPSRVLPRVALWMSEFGYAVQVAELDGKLILLSHHGNLSYEPLDGNQDPY